MRLFKYEYIISKYTHMKMLVQNVMFDNCIDNVLFLLEYYIKRFNLIRMLSSNVDFNFLQGHANARISLRPGYVTFLKISMGIIYQQKSKT